MSLIHTQTTCYKSTAFIVSVEQKDSHTTVIFADTSLCVNKGKLSPHYTIMTVQVFF